MGLNYKVIGGRLKKARLDKKMTQENLAELVDVSVTYISRIETGSSEINLKRISQICNLLDVDEAFIISGAATSKNYMTSDFNDLLKDCPSDKLKLIYDLAKVVVESK